MVPDYLDWDLPEIVRQLWRFLRRHLPDRPAVHGGIKGDSALPAGGGGPARGATPPPTGPLGGGGVAGCIGQGTAGPGAGRDLQLEPGAL